jgi:carboxylate-amine ligase
MVDAGLIEDSTRIWWDIRPSARFPTLETRIMDVCTRIEDTVALTAYLVCTLRMLWRLRSANQRWRMYTPMLIRENRWRAMRYSYDEGLIDLGKGVVVPFEDLLNEMLGLVAEDAEILGCADEVNSLRHILQRGTSAHRQLKTYELERASGASDEDALKGVVDGLIEDTVNGL